MVEENLVPEQEEKRGFVDRALDYVAEIVAENPNITKSVIGAIASIASVPFAGPVSVGVGVVAAVAAEGVVRAASARHSDTLKRRASLQKERIKGDDGGKSQTLQKTTDGVSVKHEEEKDPSRPSADPHIAGAAPLSSQQQGVIH